jgi:hypothetical protein
LSTSFLLHGIELGVDSFELVDTVGAGMARADRGQPMRPERACNLGLMQKHIEMMFHLFAILGD